MIAGLGLPPEIRISSLNSRIGSSKADRWDSASGKAVGGGDQGF